MTDRNGNLSASHAGAQVAVDPREVRQEAMIAMLEREHRSLTSSLLALALFAVSFSFYSFALPFFLLLGMRTASFVITRTSASRLERAVRKRLDTTWPHRMMVVSMAVTGITLGLLLMPPPPDTPFAAVLMVRTVVLVAVTLIAVTLAAMTMPRDAMLASFFLTVCALAFVLPERADPAVGLVAAMTVIGIRVYAFNTGHHIVAAARVLVENRKLSEELGHALAKAEYLGSRDPLTRLYNRHRLFQEREAGSPDGMRQLLVIDLDRFKAINDSLGHSAGDQVLVAAADAIRDRLAALGGDGHLAFRLGGEEFLIILDQADCTAAREFAESVRLAIAGIAEREPGLAQARITASIGIARWYPGEELDDVLQRSDAACYKAKDAGRNTVRAAA